MTEPRTYRDRDGDLWREMPTDLLVPVFHDGTIGEGTIERDKLEHRHGPLIQVPDELPGTVLNPLPPFDPTEERIFAGEVDQ